jgi:hypothetical protein
MPSIEQCLEQVTAVREAAVDPKAAYVIRSRLERLLLSCAGVSQTSGIEGISTACDKLHELSASVCRPSESLDVRWDEGWSQMRPALDELEALLLKGAQSP